MRKRILAFIIVFIFIFSMMISPAFAAPPNPNHTITVNGSGFDGTGNVDFNLLQDGKVVNSFSFDGTSVNFTNLNGGTYSIFITSVTDGYEASVSPESVKLVGREKSETFTITLSGGVVEDTEIVSVETLSDINVDYGTSAAEIPLPETLEVTLDDGTTTSLGVIWDTSSYDGHTAGTYTFAGNLILVEGIANTAGYTATVDVIVAEEVVIDKELVSVETLADINVDYGTELSQITLPETVEVTLDDETKTSLGVNWNTSTYNGQTAGTYTFAGELVLVEGIANTAGYTATVNVIVAEEVVVETIHYLALGDSIATGTTG
ncbi:MAG: Ig-like domain-containing protein, partial [Bacillota bacterium]|nr:Ig-like domain-containing protein [Bacillota bacterium]